MSGVTLKIIELVIDPLKNGRDRSVWGPSIRMIVQTMDFRILNGRVPIPMRPNATLRRRQAWPVA